MPKRERFQFSRETLNLGEALRAENPQATLEEVKKGLGLNSLNAAFRLKQELGWQANARGQSPKAREDSEEIERLALSGMSERAIVDYFEARGNYSRKAIQTILGKSGVRKQIKDREAKEKLLKKQAEAAERQVRKESQDRRRAEKSQLKEQEAKEKERKQALKMIQKEEKKVQADRELGARTIFSRSPTRRSLVRDIFKD